MPYKNIEKKREYCKSYMRKWRQENPDKVRIIADKENKRRRESESYKSHKREVFKNWYHSKIDIRLMYRAYNFRISLEALKQMIKDQDNKCWICSIDFNKTIMCLDHNHQTGKLRKLLCTDCNRMLGGAKDNISILQKAIEYLSVTT